MKKTATAQPRQVPHGSPRANPKFRPAVAPKTHPGSPSKPLCPSPEEIPTHEERGYRPAVSALLRPCCDGTASPVSFSAYHQALQNALIATVCRPIPLIRARGRGLGGR